MAGTRRGKKTSIESTIEDQLKELKDLLQETNQKVTSLETQIFKRSQRTARKNRCC